MACFKPLLAYRLEDGSSTFDRRQRGIVSEMPLPCNRCMGCRIGNAMDWQTRLVHEAGVTDGASCVMTLTYEDGELPPFGSLSRRDFVLFMKRLRKELSRAGVRIRFFGIGEYSPEMRRPHYHVIVFGWWPADARFWSSSASGGREHVSEQLSRLWGHGRVTFQEFSAKAAAYCARYMTEKLSAARSESMRRVVDPVTGEVVGTRETEFMRSSRRPGIGAGFVERYEAQLLAHDFTVIDGKRRPLPKYYDRRLALVDAGAVADRKAERQLAGVGSAWNRTAERLAVREKVTLARIADGKRSGCLDR